MFTFRRNQHCYWLCISNMEQLENAIEKHFIYPHAYDDIQEKFDKGLSLMVNSISGYHYGKLDEYSDEITTKKLIYPN